ncbi:hypothetical protein FQN54_001581 [Arachnomyces sp. PD_36]|nr:hypothetical protein FQN54_001581 [Arachnomyces sp. PD_36]
MVGHETRGAKAEVLEWEYYRYDPSLVAAIIFIALFFITTGIHTFQLIRSRTWYFIPLVIGGFFQAIGYIGRVLSSNETPNWTLGPYIMQTLLILVAPALFAASVYMVLGRIILLVDGEELSMIRKRWLTKIFVTGDILSFVMQGAGGGIMSGGNLDSMKTGENIVVGGLFIQIAFFSCFITVATIFHSRLRKRPTERSLSRDVPWQKHLIVLYIASSLILIRSIFRVVEYIQGNNGYLLRKEIFLYIFDAVLMWGTMVIFNIVHPSQITEVLRNKMPDFSSGHSLEDVNSRHGFIPAGTFGLEERQS